MLSTPISSQPVGAGDSAYCVAVDRGGGVVGVAVLELGAHGNASFGLDCGADGGLYAGAGHQVEAVALQGHGDDGLHLDVGEGCTHAGARAGGEGYVGVGGDLVAVDGVPALGAEGFGVREAIFGVVGDEGCVGDDLAFLDEVAFPLEVV